MAENQPPVAKQVAETWLTDFSSAITAGDANAIADLILPFGWFRDMLTLTWDFRALEGREKIIAFLKGNLKPGQITNVRLYEDQHLLPIYVPTTGGVEAAFTFETSTIVGKGYTRLARGEGGVWRALIVTIVVSELKGHEESGNELGIYGGHTLAWKDVLAERREHVEQDPHVIVLGAGQTGLNIASRFKQNNIPTIVIDKNDRVGDNWRQRYPTLALHTIREHHSLLYQPYPSNWPTFTPRDKLADWLESYALNQDLVIWNKSRFEGKPVYNEAEKKWTATVNRDGKLFTFHPAHILVATGTLGDPRLVQLPSQERFRGTILHAEDYRGGTTYSGKRVVVVGAGNTGIDMCQDLCFHKAQSVTMVQRSSTCVRSGDKLAKKMAHIWTESIPVEVGDFKWGTMGLGLLRTLMKTQTEQMWEEEKELYDKLRKGGVALNMGPDGSGHSIMFWERGGGYWLDKGGAELIESGDIKVKQGVEPAGYTEDGVIFSDGSELEADIVIYATGWSSMRDTSRKVFGDEVIDQTCQVYGLDQEGELRGSYRPSGHPGLWFCTGDFWNSRFMGKLLAIQIKATELGLIQA